MEKTDTTTIRLTVPVILHDRELDALARILPHLVEPPAQGSRSLVIREALAMVGKYFVDGCTCMLLPEVGIVTEQGKKACPVHGSLKE